MAAGGMDQESIVRRELTSRCIAIVSICPAGIPVLSNSNLLCPIIPVYSCHVSQMNRADPVLLE